MSRVAQRVEEWKRKIVDLSRRNRLLFFSRTRASTLRIVEPGLPEIFDHLINEEKSWRFLIPSDDEGAEESENDPAIPEARPDADLALEYQEAHGDRRPRSRPSPRHADELLTDIENGVDLRKSLRNLHRRSRTDFEERGVRILFIAFGVLKWKEIEQSETVTSPVLLVPVELKRDSVNDPFRLWPVDEDMVINPALAVKLANDFNIQLPAVPEDWDSLSVVEFLAAFEEETAKYNWSVEQDCWLGLFSFHKLVIYHDLKTHAQLLDAHSIVRCLCEEERTPISEDPSEPRELDQKTSPETSFLVADADSSQLVCIEAVKAGNNLVIQGPPGTGKSQTITNLVAEFIARGKSVLFVSEKMAALEVVFQRLLNANLGHFCLQLHSHRANKRDVIQELYRTHLEQLQPKRGLTEYEARQLVERRKKLNEYVHSLHLVRRPVGHSAYEGLGWLAELADIPYVPAGLFDASTMTPETLDSAEQLSYRLIPVWGVALAGVEFPWFGCSSNAFTLENKAKLQATLSECLEGLGVLAETMSQTGRRLGLEGLPTVSGAEWFLEAGRLLKQCPKVEKLWIVDSDLEALLAEAAKYRDLSKIYQEHRSALTSRYKTDFLSLPNDLRDDIKGSVEELSSYLRQPLLVEDDSAFVASRSTLLEWAHDLEARLENWIQDGEALQRVLGLQGTLSVRRLRQLIRIADLCQSENRPDESWFDVLKLREVLQFLPGIRDAFERRNGERRSLLTVYEPRILELDAKALIEKFAGPYSSFFRIFRPGYYKARGQINSLRKDGQLPHSILSDLRRVQSFKGLERHLVENFPRNKQLLGACFKGLETDFERVTRAVSVAEELVDLAGIQPIHPQFIRAASVQGIATPDLRSVGKRLERSLAEWEKRLSTVNSLLLSDPDGGAGLPFEETPVLDLKRWSRRFHDSLELFCNLIGRALSCAHSAEGFSCLRIIVDFDRLAQLRKIESQLSAETDHLKERYGSRFAGVSTAWGEILEAIQWAARFMRHLGNRQVPDLLLSLIVAPGEGVLDTDSLGHALNRVRGAFQQLSSNFHEGLPAVNGTPLLQSDYGGMATRLQQMLKQLDALRDWIDYKALEVEFHQQGLGELLANMVSKATLVRPEDVPKVVRRSLLQAWLNWVFAQDPSLGGFRGDNHERLIAEFQQLDRKHWEQGVHSVIREVSRHRPVASVVIPGGELQILLKEANKQRRHLPLRKLFGLIPSLLTQLKPCLLMSPISVSQFLDPEKTKFDLVIFDEASQLRSEDAVCSVYRGKQLVVCGDNKQLPPTTFFEQGMSDELLDEADDASAMEAFDVFGSILDACAAVMPQRQLKWHYRSEHESLIAFSNCTFYDYSLVTFPSWLEEDDGLGVKFVHVPDGVYDRGGRRDNVQEAKKVVSLVEEHFRRFPKQSLGVVTFNIAQADTIENVLEQFRRQNPELDRYFGDDRPEKFFVKHLESVQGDERDVLIFSVGYGRDKFGRLTMNFGPLNSSGGERRLNVAVTRARKKVIVVSSITASDFDLGEIRAEGVRVFQRYLDFAENGPQALETKLAVSEFESPLEQSVAATIRTFGFDVIPQVGCSSFRVDLGIVDPTRPGRFVLGVECDGALYHSSAAARDRDRIRQQVLERLGWRIHRIWSPDWVTQRETEVGRLRAAIEAARSGGSRSISDDSPQSSNGPRITIEPPVVIEKDPPRINDIWVIPEWVVKYRVSKPRAPVAHGLQFHDPRALPLLKGMLSQIVEVEGPIHKEVAARRLASAWDLERVGDRMMNAVKSAWRSLHRDGLLNIQGAFLWPANPTFQLAVRQPNPDDEEAWRPINEIPPEEIVLAMTSLVRDSLSLRSETLLLYVARIFGFERTGAHIQKALEDTFDELVETGQLALKDGRVSLPN